MDLLSYMTVPAIVVLQTAGSGLSRTGKDIDPLWDAGHQDGFPEGFSLEVNLGGALLVPP